MAYGVNRKWKIDLFSIVYFRRLPLLITGWRLGQPIVNDFALTAPGTDQIVAFLQDV